MSSKIVEYSASGRRKEAVARVRLALGVGKKAVNGMEFNAYFTDETLRGAAVEPMIVTETDKQYDLMAVCSGGGKSGQAGALRLAISRALLKADLKFRPELKKRGMLTRDPRMKERKKTGQPGARKRFQFSKR